MEEAHTTWSGLTWVKNSGFVLGKGGESWHDGKGEACLEQTGREHRSRSHPPTPPACLFFHKAVAVLGQGEERYLMRIWKALQLCL